jgi:hypothetical protein
VRIVDASGRPVVESAGGRQRHPGDLLLRIPESVSAAVESGDWSAFQLEVDLDGVWCGAVLVNRAEPLVDAEVMQPKPLRVVS